MHVAAAAEGHPKVSAGNPRMESEARVAAACTWAVAAAAARREETPATSRAIADACTRAAAAAAHTWAVASVVAAARREETPATHRVVVVA